MVPGSLSRMHGSIQGILNELAPFEPVVVYQFGSTAQDRERGDSDLDLALLSRQTCEPYDVFEAAQRIASLVGRDVDMKSGGRCSRKRVWGKP